IGCWLTAGLGRAGVAVGGQPGGVGPGRDGLLADRWPGASRGSGWWATWRRGSRAGWAAGWPLGRGARGSRVVGKLPAGVRGVGGERGERWVGNLPAWVRGGIGCGLTAGRGRAGVAVGGQPAGVDPGRDRLLADRWSGASRATSSVDEQLLPEEGQHPFHGFVLAVHGQCRVLAAGELDPDERVGDLVAQRLRPGTSTRMTASPISWLSVSNRVPVARSLA